MEGKKNKKLKKKSSTKESQGLTLTLKYIKSNYIILLMYKVSRNGPQTDKVSVKKI